MRVVVPAQILDANIVSSNVTEDDYDEWDNLTDYSVGDYVISTSTHRVYRAVDVSGPSSSVVDPTTDTDSSHWQNVSATNKWRPFDGKSAAKCQRANTITYTFEGLGLVDGVALHGLLARTATLVIVRDSVEVYNTTVNLANQQVVNDWYDYMFEEVSYLDRMEFPEVPPYSNATYTITLDNTGSTAVLGQIVIGRTKKLGTAVFSPNLGLVNFDEVSEDEFGNETIVERGKKQTTRYSVIFPTPQSGYVFSVIAALKSTSASWSAGANTETLGTTLFGRLSTFSIDISGPVVTEMSLEIKELT